MRKYAKLHVLEQIENQQKKLNIENNVVLNEGNNTS